MIQSTQNNLIKKAVKLKEKKYRDEYGLFIIEGEKLIDEAASWDFEYILISENYKNAAEEKYKNRSPVYLVKDELLKKAADTISPQGIAAIAKQKRYTVLNKDINPFIVVCEKVSDPGNLGAVIRTAYAAGASELVLSEGCADIYNPKVVRAAAGALFHLPVLCGVDLKNYIAQAKIENNIFFFGAHLKAVDYPYKMDLKKPCAFVIGNEANGLTDDISLLMDSLVKIPMHAGAESLNASVACGILIYEVVRQRLALPK